MSRFQDEYRKTGGRFSKPGDAVHTPKWDRCVEHVKASGSGADPYAVCTAMLGDESFKSMDEGKFNAVLDKALEEVEKDSFGVGGFGIAGAGPIPRSLLARQDLEGSTGVSKGFSPHAALVSRIKRNQKATVEKGGSSFRDAWASVKPR